jgi:hypothetical protein
MIVFGEEEGGRFAFRDNLVSSRERETDDARAQEERVDFKELAYKRERECV